MAAVYSEAGGPNSYLVSTYITLGPGSRTPAALSRILYLVSHTIPLLSLSDMSKMDSSITMPPPASLLGLPTELQYHIIRFLDFPDTIYLKMTCTRFNNLIRPLTHRELLEAERSTYGMERKLHACRYCLRLRPPSKFADKMLVKKRSKYGREAGRRFCMECGITPQPPEGSTPYSLGSQILVHRMRYILCFTCRRLGKHTQYDDFVECDRCFKARQDREQRREDRARRRAEQAARRAVQLESDGYADSEDHIPPSSTLSDMACEMAQAEADLLTNEAKFWK